MFHDETGGRRPQSWGVCSSHQSRVHNGDSPSSAHLSVYILLEAGGTKPLFQHLLRNLLSSTAHFNHVLLLPPQNTRAQPSSSCLYKKDELLLVFSNMFFISMSPPQSPQSPLGPLFLARTSELFQPPPLSQVQSRGHTAGVCSSCPHLPAPPLPTPQAGAQAGGVRSGQQHGCVGGRLLQAGRRPPCLCTLA